jgi:hypothetical protein
MGAATIVGCTYALLREYKATLDLKWMRHLGAHAMGIGGKLVSGKPTDTLALSVCRPKTGGVAAWAR